MVEGIVLQQQPTAMVAARPVSFEAIVYEYQTRIARYIFRLVNDRELALDLTQDTFVSALRNIQQLRSERALSAWLYKIATNLAIHARKKNQRFKLEALGDHENNATIATPAPDTRSMDRELVHNALMQIPRDRAACLLLHLREGFSYVEVATIMGTTPEGARKRIARAKQQFRAIYDASNTRDSQHALL